MPSQWICSYCGGRTSCIHCDALPYDDPDPSITQRLERNKPVPNSCTGGIAANDLFAFLNRSGNVDIDNFLLQAQREHRTLQQAFTGLCFAWINAIADDDTNRWDARNEDAVAWACKIKNALPTLPNSLPLI